MILLANHGLVRYGGTETWTYEMARVLRNFGHDVEVYTLLNGEIGERIEDLGATVIQNPPIHKDYELAIVNHMTCQGMLERLGCRKVYTQHGPTHRLEQALPGADVYVGVSEEVLATMAMRGLTPNLIRNGVDLGRFTPKKTNRDRPVVLSLCKNAMGRDMVKRACERAGYGFDSVHWADAPTFDVSDKMRDADIVVTYGRGAYEALACGKAVFVFDARSETPRGDGWLTKDNVADLVQYNCSGRARNITFDEDGLVDALLRWQPNDWGREWAERHHNIDAVATKYLSFTKPDFFHIHDDVLEVINL